jgi:deoxyribodipyrimidine photo-lyase
MTIDDSNGRYWQPTRAAALAALEDFVPRAGSAYARERNFDWGPQRRANVSRLSPWIRTRLLTEEEVVRAVLQRHSAAAAEKFLQEVCWRTYWKGWLALRSAVWQRYRRDVDRLAAAWADDSRLQAAEAGQTGIEVFDAFARELVETGYLHNHARMWFASIWIFTLQLPWALGADFFFRHLLDGDPASNTLGWRWVAGLQTKGKHYLARPDNIFKYTGERMGQGLTLNVEAEPLTEDDELPAVQRLPDLPISRPAGRVGLLVTEEDVRAAADWRTELAPDAIAGWMPDAMYRQARISERVITFRKACLTDSGVSLLEGHDVVDAVHGWMAEQQLDAVLISEPSVGLWDEPMQQLTATALRVNKIRRPWDSQLWPHATHGFFRFKQRLPRFREKIG